MYDAILFDLDGTLTDPRIGITKSIQYALSKFGIVEENLDMLISFIGEPLFECFQRYYPLGEEEARQAMDFYREYYSETGIYENAVYPAIPGLLESLHGKGKKLVLATLKPTVPAVWAKVPGCSWTYTPPPEPAVLATICPPLIVMLPS